MAGYLIREAWSEQNRQCNVRLHAYFAHLSCERETPVIISSRCIWSPGLACLQAWPMLFTETGT